MKTCAVIPAAGRGSRLGLDQPKLLVELGANLTAWSVLREKLLGVVDTINVIVSPRGQELLRERLREDSARARIALSVQARPMGMGDAIFCGYPVWREADAILVIWGDQVAVRQQTIRRALALHAGAPRTVVLPTVALPQPYVEYVFDGEGLLTAVRQSREGDACTPNGQADIGTFALSTAGLHEAWEQYCVVSGSGALTGERNFLPFLPYLSAAGWAVKRMTAAHPDEARGINTPADLDFLRSLAAAGRLN